MKSIILSFLFFFSYSVFSQEHFVGLKSGFGITEIKNKGDNVELGLVTEIGLTYLYRTKNRITFSSEIIRSTKRFEYTYYSYPEHVKIVEDIDIKYFSFPIKLGYTIVDKCKLDVNVGFISSLRYQDARAITSELDIPSERVNENRDSEYALHADISFNVASFSNSEIYSVISYVRSVGNLFEFNPRVGFPRRIFTYDFAMGYRMEI